MEPQPADFFLAPMPGIGGASIRFGQFLNGEGFRKYQHAGILLEGGLTMEAMPHGASRLHISRFKPEELRWSTGLIDLTDVQRRLILDYAEVCRGIGYSFLDYEALALHRFHIPAPKLEKFISDSGHMICSQLVDFVYAKAGVHLFNDNRWPGYVTPASLDHLLDDITDYRMGMGI